MDKTFKQKLEILPIKNIDHPVGNTKYYAAVHVKSLIAQADEEFQELLDKYSNLNDHYEKEVIKSSKLESQIANLKSQLQQQALPVVPEFVGEWIEHCKGMGYGLIAALTFKLSSTMHEELSAKILKWLGNEGNDETFALAFITGKYQVEKPQLFKLIFPNSTAVLQKDGELNSFADTVYKRYLMENAMTEQEIKSIDERYWQFAVLVEDGE